jgi:hypothetical protein
MIGYDAVGVVSSIDNTGFGTAQRDSINALTRAMILHPIACGLAFIAFLVSAGAGFLGSFLASMVAFVAWLVTLVIMTIDLTVFGVRAFLRVQHAYYNGPLMRLLVQILRNHINSNNTGNYAEYSTGMWTCIAAMASLFLGSMIVLFTCCSARRVSEKERRRWFY